MEPWIHIQWTPISVDEFWIYQQNELFIEIQYPVNQCIDGINDYEFTYP